MIKNKYYCTIKLFHLCDCSGTVFPMINLFLSCGNNFKLINFKKLLYYYISQFSVS